MRGTYGVSTALTACLALAGCQACRPPCAPQETCAGCYPRPVLGVLPLHPLTPSEPAPIALAPPPPALVAPVPPAPVQRPPEPAAMPPGSPGMEQRGYGPLPSAPVQAQWQAPQSAQSAPGESAEPPRETVRLSPPERRAPPSVPSQQPAIQGTMPVGIPQFAIVSETASAGLRPLVEGLEWLRANHYAAVLYIKRPGQDDSSDRQQAERFGMSYLSLAVSPETLSPAVVDEFNRLLRAQPLQPLFVYDSDGTVAGGLWYLYFRMVDRADDSNARARAHRLGLRENAEGSGRAMWLAIEKFLSSR